MKINFRILPLLLCCVLYLTVPGQSQELRLTLLHTNDEHSHLIPIPAVDDHNEMDNPATGGFARLSGAVNRVRNQKTSEGEPVLLLSGGDFLGGPAFGWLPLMDGIAAELSMMQKIGYDAVVIGNHEFDYGTDVLADYLTAAGYPDASDRMAILGTNIRPPSSHRLSEMGIRNTIIKELPNGLRVGIFGIIGNDAISKTASPEPVEFDDPVQSARLATESLMEAGVDLIIAVNHAGVTEDRQLATAIPDIDVIVGGHTHTALSEPVYVGETVIVQAGNYLNYLGILELSVNRETGEVTVVNDTPESPFLLELNSSVAEDAEIADEVDRYRMLLNNWVAVLTGNQIAEITQIVAKSTFPVLRNEPQRESALGNYVTDAMKKAAGEVLEDPVDIAVQANGAIRSDIVPGSQPWSLDRVSFYDLMMAVGLGSGSDGNPGYPMVSFYITEDEVRRALEVSVLLSELMGDNYYLQFSGMKMLYDPSRAVLFHIPFTDTPIPTSRAVLSAELETSGDSLNRLEKGGERLLHVVTDYYIAGFLPMVGEFVPSLTIELKDKNGVPINLDDAVIYRNGTQLKVWQAVLGYTLSFERGEDGLPVIPDQYSEPEGRQVLVFTLPLWVWPLVALFIVVSVIVFVVKRR